MRDEVQLAPARGARAPIECAQAPSSGECYARLIGQRLFSRLLRNGMTVAVTTIHAHSLSPTMPLLTTVRRTLYALLSARFIELQKKRVVSR
jgi:hypothetical protein